MNQSKLESFSSAVVHRLKPYVYLLIDPRHAETPPKTVHFGG
jgi:hypothetical protein